MRKVDVRLTVPESSKDDIEKIKKLKIENSSGLFIKMMDLVNVTKVRKPVNIVRADFKRSVMGFTRTLIQSRR